jgi:hypothetical protein
MPSNSNAATIEKLKEQIDKLKAAPRTSRVIFSTGLPSVDGLLPLRGLLWGQVVELRGEAASGKTAVALRALAKAQGEGKLCAYVDGPGELYPPSAAALGIRLSELLIVRPKAPGQLVWTAAQLLRSGAFPCVALDTTHTGLRPSLSDNKKLTDAAASGQSLLLWMTSPHSPAEAGLSLHLRPEGARGIRVEVGRSRMGGAGNSAFLSASELWREEAPPRYASPGALASQHPWPGSFSSKPSRHHPRWGITGQRPGRDAPFPSLVESLEA